MKTVFILNPEAGKKNNLITLSESIKRAALDCGKDVEIYITKAQGDATDFVRGKCEDGEHIRFIACGGDGTLSEVVCGAIGYDNAEIGVIPMGTGNDFCRNFSKDYDFASPEAQLCGDTVECDAIKYTTEVDGKRVEGYCANMFNIGFDCNVADLTGTIKKKTPLAGSLAYFAAILATLVRKKCTELEVFLDDKKAHDGKLLLTSLANGSFCGGGIMSNPGAAINDGLINVNIINNVSRLRFISLLPYYMKGTHGSLRGIERVITTCGAQRVKIVPKDNKIRLCIDGEIIDAGVTEFEVVHNAFHFVLPQVQKSEGILSAK